jgi:hypothetical protein
MLASAMPESQEPTADSREPKGSGPRNGGSPVRERVNYQTAMLFGSTSRNHAHHDLYPMSKSTQYICSSAVVSSRLVSKAMCKDILHTSHRAGSTERARLVKVTYSSGRVCECPR